MLKIAICDDNTQFLDQIQACLGQWNHEQEPLRIPISRSCHREFETAYFAVIFQRKIN